jgi:hypothetical protein
MNACRFAPFVAAISLGALMLLGCGGDPTVPALSDLRLEGQAPASPVVLLLAVDFADEDGDLAGGTMERFIDGKPDAAGEGALRTIFAGSHLEPDATAGTLEFVVELTFDFDNPPAEGTLFELGVRVKDEAGHSSNLATRRLRIDPPQ